MTKFVALVPNFSLISLEDSLEFLYLDLHFFIVLICIEQCSSVPCVAPKHHIKLFLHLDKLDAHFLFGFPFFVPNSWLFVH